MPNSLTLKQCHFDGQSSILFPKYIFEFSQGLHNPDRILFFTVFPFSPHIANSGLPLTITFWFSDSRFPLWTVFKYKEKASRIWFTGLEKICSKYLENKRLHCFEKWHCLSDSEFVIFRSVFVSFSSLSTSRSLNRPDRSDTRRTFLHLTLSDF